MNKNDYIRDLNKVKTTDSMKKRLLNLAEANEVDESVRNIRYTRRIGLIASVVLLLTVGAVIFTLGTGKGNIDRATQVGSEPDIDTTKDSNIEIVTETTINHNEQPTGEQPTGAQDEIMDLYNVAKDIEISINDSDDINAIVVTIKNKSQYHNYDFSNKMFFSHLEGNMHVAIGERYCIADGEEFFTVEADSSTNIVVKKDDISVNKKLETYAGSNEFGISFMCFYTISSGTSYLNVEPVRVTFTDGKNNSITCNDINISTINTGDETFTTTLINESDEEFIYEDNRRLLEYDPNYGVWHEVPLTNDTYSGEKHNIKQGENIIITSDLITNYLDYEFKNTEYCMTNYFKTKNGKIMYLEYFRIGIEQGQKMLISTDTENDIVVTKAEHNKDVSVSPYAIEFEVMNLTDKIFMTGQQFSIYNYDSVTNEYREIPLKEGACWEDIAYEVKANSKYEFSLCLDFLYDMEHMNDGIYKIVKRFGNKEYVLMRFTMNEGEFEIYKNSKSNNVFCKDANYSVTSGECKHLVDVTFVNISEFGAETGEGYFIYKFNEETCKYENLAWKDGVAVTLVATIVNPKDEYSVQFYLDGLYDIANFDDGLYKVVKDFNDVEVTVGEFIVKNGELTFYN
ncbi:MAG: hypothetical protein IJC76_06800 [Lachnospiraceae bacterium]|nr:hypothetical protein [Lachnospiraceae bacterium]